MQNERSASVPSAPLTSKWILASRQTIGAKIFGLAGLLLILTIILALFLLNEVEKTRRDMKVVVTLDMPLAQATADINESGLRRRIAFERWAGALSAADPNPEIISESSANYALFSKRLAAGFNTAHELINRYPDDTSGRQVIVEVSTLLNEIEAIYITNTAYQSQVLDLLRARKMEQANTAINMLNDLQHMLQEQRANIESKTNTLSLNMARAVEARQRTVLWLTISATISTVLLGLALAAMVTERLTRPVRSLVTAMDEVQHGHLDVEIPVISRDEIGALTKAFNFFIGELRAKEHLKQTFGKYIDPRVLQHLITRDGTMDSDGGRRIMTILFADMVAFAALSERLTPSLMVSMLNRHFGLQSQAVQSHLGVVDKFIGDALMAFWGPPFTDANVHASMACRSALAQLEALDVLRRELPEITGLRKGLPELDMCIGIGTGDVVVGNIGSENARSYTVIGDTVNLTSRIESANRSYGTHILISEETAHSVGAEFALREIDTITVKGKTEVTRIFELMATAEKLSPVAAELRDSYAEALHCYREQDWDGAESLFMRCLELKPDDGPARVMFGRLPKLRAQALPSNWNGVFVLTEK